ncbi:MAG: adenine phosphoribosyltransferase [Candidatus Omnitrophica bacterium]|jgi:adenine phosphoribosyltransferase|nr:adenine phosphoribosyltransferase [Candidatus Omnitrophota bacterium]
MRLEQYIRSIPDFPKKGILFRDITTLLNNKKAFRFTINELARILKNKKIEYILAAESRGFIFGGALAYKLNCGFVPVRKPGKLPFKTYFHTYSLEYGKDSLEIHQDAFPKGARILILDDLLATGGTALALINLAKKLEAKVVAVTFLIELVALQGAKKLKGYPLYSLIKF